MTLSIALANQRGSEEKMEACSRCLLYSRHCAIVQLWPDNAYIVVKMLPKYSSGTCDSPRRRVSIIVQMVRIELAVPYSIHTLSTATIGSKLTLVLRVQAHRRIFANR